jgi:hypothetical protein
MRKTLLDRNIIRGLDVCMQLICVSHVKSIPPSSANYVDGE